MKRPTRVPASSVVRMNSASNMIAKWYQSAFTVSPPSACEKISAMPTARLGAPPVRESRLCSPIWRRQRRQLRRIEREAPAADRAGGALDAGADDRGGRVDGEVDARLHHRGREQRHDRHEALHQHRAVADEARVGLAVQQLRRGAARDQRVEARDRAAGDRDEAEREQLAREDGPAAVDELRQRRQLHGRLDGEQPDAPAARRSRS